MNKLDTVFKVGLILLAIAFIVGMVAIVQEDSNNRTACIKAGYTDRVALNGMLFCYKINPATLALFDSLAK